jgi:hypothetical protein
MLVMSFLELDFDGRVLSEFRICFSFDPQSPSFEHPETRFKFILTPSSQTAIYCTARLKVVVCDSDPAVAVTVTE